MRELLLLLLLLASQVSSLPAVVLTDCSLTDLLGFISMAQKNIYFSQLQFAAGLWCWIDLWRSQTSCRHGKRWSREYLPLLWQQNWLKLPWEHKWPVITAELTPPWLNCLESFHGLRTSFDRKAISSVIVFSFCVPSALLCSQGTDLSHIASTDSSGGSSSKGWDANVENKENGAELIMYTRKTSQVLGHSWCQNMCLSALRNP